MDSVSKRVVRIGPVARSDEELVEILTTVDEPGATITQCCTAPCSAEELVELASGYDVVVCDPVPRGVLSAALGTLHDMGLEVHFMRREERRVHRAGRLYRYAGPPVYQRAS